jgi:hypothetical protein
VPSTGAGGAEPKICAPSPPNGFAGAAPERYIHRDQPDHYDGETRRPTAKGLPAAGAGLAFTRSASSLALLASARLAFSASCLA